MVVLLTIYLTGVVMFPWCVWFYAKVDGRTVMRGNVELAMFITMTVLWPLILPYGTLRLATE